MKKKWFLGLFSLLCLLGLSGCWDRQELNNLAIVAGVAIDQDEAEPEQVQLTVQLIKPEGISTPTGGEGGAGGEEIQAYLNLTETAGTPFEAVRQFTHVLDRKLYFSHNKILIIGREIAEKGVSGYLDIFFRDPEPRLTAWLLVAEGKGAEALEVQAQIEQIPALNIEQIIDVRAATSEIVAANAFDFMSRLLCVHRAPVAPLLSVETVDGVKVAKLVETVVFKNDKMVGTLNKVEGRGLLWVLGEVKKGIIIVPCLSCQQKISLEIMQARGKIIPEIKEGNLEITVKIKEEGNLGSQMCACDLTELATWQTLEDLQAKAIEKEIRAALQKARELNVDIFGFGRMVHKKLPHLWAELADHWEEIFPELKVNIIIETKLRKTGLITKPVSAGEKCL